MVLKENALKSAVKMQRTLSLRLYKSILTSHRVLPGEMRFIGDAYVREEFKLHKNAKPEHLRPFFEEWIAYLRLMQDMDVNNMGKDLPAEEIAKLSDEQRDKLVTMFNETQALFETGITLEMEVEAESTRVAREKAEKEAREINERNGVFRKE